MTGHMDSKEKRNKVNAALTKRTTKVMVDELAEPLPVLIEEDETEFDCDCPYCKQSYSTDRDGEKWIIWTNYCICSGRDDYKNIYS